MGIIKLAATGGALKDLFKAMGKDVVTGGRATKRVFTPKFMQRARILMKKNKQLRGKMADQAKAHAEEAANTAKAHASEMANASKTALEGQRNQALHDKKKLRKTIVGLAAGSLGADAVMNAAWYRKTKKLKKEQNV